MIIADGIPPNETQHDKDEIIKFWNSIEALLDPKQISKSGITSNNVANSCF